MAVMTIRDKNQVTIPQALLVQTSLRPGDPIEFTALADGGIGIYPFGTRARGQSLWDAAIAWARAAPGVADIDLDVPSRDLSTREVEW